MWQCCRKKLFIYVQMKSNRERRLYVIQTTNIYKFSTNKTVLMENFNLYIKRIMNNAVSNMLKIIETLISTGKRPNNYENNI